MISIGATALTFLDRASKVTGLANNIKLWVKEMLPAQQKEVRLLLERLCSRVDALMRPMQYCWLWAADKESSVADTVYHCRKTLLRVEEHIGTLLRTRKTTDTERTIRELRDHLSDLDFCVHSLSLSLHIISTTQRHLQGAQDGAQQSSPISPNCLLKASSRLVEMHSTSGDVASAKGILYSRVPGRRRSWQPVFHNALWSIQHDSKTHKYVMLVLSLTPVTEVTSTTTSGYQMQNRRASGRLRFELDPSLGLRRIEAGEMIGREDTKPIFHNQAEGTGDFTEINIDQNDNPKSYDEPNHEQRDQMEGFVWTQRVANTVQYEYGFVLCQPGYECTVSGNSSKRKTAPDRNTDFPLEVGCIGGGDSIVESLGKVARGGGEGLAVTTLLYMSRLCVYENWALQSGERLWVDEPFHKKASDEELSLLLVHGTLPSLKHLRSSPKKTAKKSNVANEVPAKDNSKDRFSADTKSTKAKNQENSTCIVKATPGHEKVTTITESLIPGSISTSRPVGDINESEIK